MATDNKYPVPVYTQKHGFIRVEDGATKGATIGQDLLFLDDGVAGARELGISTGLLEGGKITINADPTKIDIAAGRALFVDFTQHEPVVVTKAFGPYIGVPINDIAIQPVTYISIDKDLNVVQTSAELTNAQRRSMVELGIAVHTNRTTINVINTLAQTIESTAAQLHDFMEAVGPFNKSGNVYSAVGGNLQLRKTAGDIFKFGVAYDTTPHDPHTIDQPSVNPITFRYRKRDSVEYADTTNVDPNNYDLGGVLTAVQANRYTVQRIYMFQSGLTRIQYGQAEYQTLNEAVGNFEKEVFETELNMRTNGIIRGFLVVKQGATDLADPAQAQFFEASKFGLATGAGGGGVDFATIVAALGYTPANQARDLIAGDGLIGGGDLAATRTVAMGTPSTVTTSTTNSTTADSHTHALTIADGALTIAKTSGLQGALDAKAPIASPNFTGSISAPYVIHLGPAHGTQYVAGALRQSGQNVWQYGVDTDRSYRLWSYTDGGAFLNTVFALQRDAVTMSANSQAWYTSGDLQAKDLHTNRGDGTGAVWFGGGTGYLYRKNATQFEFRAGASFYQLENAGTIWTTGNFTPANYVAKGASDYGIWRKFFRYSTGDGTNVDNAFNEHGFNYGTGGLTATGPFISFGQLDSSTGYQMQITGNYGDGRAFWRTRNGDTNTWNALREIASLNISQTFTTRLVTSSGHFNSTIAAAVVSAEAGPIYLRPNGSDTTTNQVTVNTNGDLVVPQIVPVNAAGSYISGNGSGTQFNGNWYHTGQFYRLSANSAAWVTQPRTFVQATDPGAQAADGDIWIW